MCNQKYDLSQILAEFVNMARLQPDLEQNLKSASALLLTSSLSCKK